MTIIEKLKLTKYEHMAVLHQPTDYDLFDGYETALSNKHDAIFIFVEHLEEMVKYTEQIIIEKVLLEKGYLFFAYPKKGNKKYSSYVHRDAIFPAMNMDEEGYVPNSDLKFSRMVSMDDVFTVVGLKRESRKEKKSSAASQCVADYENNVTDIEDLLMDYPKELTFYQSLTPGYKKDWARYIYSAKQQKTREKRITEMVDILAQGYKSRELYRQMKK